MTSLPSLPPIATLAHPVRYMLLSLLRFWSVRVCATQDTISDDKTKKHPRSGHGSPEVFGQSEFEAYLIQENPVQGRLSIRDDAKRSDAYQELVNFGVLLWRTKRTGKRRKLTASCEFNNYEFELLQPRLTLQAFDPSDHPLFDDYLRSLL
jgi:hypothetical protein